MHLYSHTTIRQIVRENSQTAAYFTNWVDVVENANWMTTQDVTKTFRNAKALNGERVRFEVSHNTFRLICSFYFPHQTCYVKFFGIHKQYDEVNVFTVAMF